MVYELTIPSSHSTTSTTMIVSSIVANLHRTEVQGRCRKTPEGEQVEKVEKVEEVEEVKVKKLPSSTVTVYFTVTISTWPSRRITVTPRSCGCRSNCRSTCASPTVRSLRRTQSIDSGSCPRENEMRRAGASMWTPSAAPSSMQTDPAGQA